MALLVLLLATINLNAQKSFVYDTIHKNEIQFGVTPALYILLGATNFGNSGLSVAYQHYYKNYTALRGKIAVFPFRETSDFEYTAIFNRSIDTLNIFSTSYNTYRPTGQLSIDYEKFFRIGNQAHSWVFELDYQHQTTFVNQTYVWYPNKMQINSTNLIKFTNGDTLGGNSAGKIYNKVDSLSYTYTQETHSIGGHFAYAIRHQVNTHLYLFASFGPSIYFRQSKRSGFKGAGNAAKFPTVTNLDFRLLVSEFCLGYRF